MYREQFSGGSESPVTADAAPDKILIVIPCLNESAHIAQLVAWVCAETAPLDRLIVVVDGGSTDGTPSLVAAIAAQASCVKLISNPKRIQSAGINLAVRAFGEGRRWLVRLDAHATYPSGYVTHLLEEAQRTGAASVVVAMRSRGDQGFQRAVALVQNSMLGAGGAAHRRPGSTGFVDHGHHALFDLDRFSAVGGYDEVVSHNEDAEFDIRLARAGGRIWLTRGVEVAYFPRATVRELFRQYVNYGHGRAATILRHRKAPKIRQVLPAAVVPALAALLCAPWIHVAVMPALLWIVTCLLAGIALALPTAPRSAIAAGIAAMTIHLGWSIGFWSELGTRLGRRNADEELIGMARAGDTAS